MALRHDNEADELARVRAEMERERAKLAALQEIGSALGSTLDLSELLERVVDQISKVMEADRTTLYLLDDETNELWSKVAQGENSFEIRLKLGEGLAGSVAKSGRSLNIKDAYQDVRFNAAWDRRSGYRTRSTLAVPMKNQHGRIIGVLQCLNKQGGYFTPKDEGLLASLASQAAVSIENSKLFLSVVGKNIELVETQDALTQKIRELDVLFEIAQVSASAPALDELFNGVLARSMRALEAEAASILLADEKTGDLHFVAAIGGEAEAVKKLRIEAGQGICGWVADHQKPQLVEDVDADPRHTSSIASAVGYHPRSALCVPLRWDGGRGAVEFLNKRVGRDAFTHDDLKLATVICGHISTAIEQTESRAREARQERLSTIGQFLSGVLHDMKTPMSVISGYVGLLVSEEDESARADLAERVKRQVKLLNTMTRETLAFARGERTLWTRKVYLYKFFDDVGEAIRTDVESRGVEFELELRNRGVAYFDEEKLARVLHNLTRNAAEAIGEQGGTCRVVADVDPADGALVIQVIDDGPGIPNAIRHRLFESFATYGKEKGTGLGLAIVKTLVEDHGGTVDVESKPGRTAFTIRIPQQVVEEAEPGAAAE